ncbi:MAG TPA: dethiobiotin synthase, partial [Polyangiales bacterium]|nr:dethiobiotin synthase [Polyangiales bacterium]
HLATGQAPPHIAGIVRHARTREREYDYVLIEAAGGLLVPIDETRTTADLARELGYPLLMVAPDRLGVLSHVLTACESAHARDLSVIALVLSPLGDTMRADPSPQTNASILERRLGIPVLRFPIAPNDDDALAAAAISCGLLDALGWS